MAAEALRAAGRHTVAVIDLDAHHGNGTQAIFWERSDVRYGSLHVDPAAGWFPHFFGHADETGAGDGTGATRNLPLPEGTGDRRWLDGVRDLAEWANGADALVVSLGVDAAAVDPESPLEVTADGYGRAGEILRELGVADGRRAGGRLRPRRDRHVGGRLPRRARLTESGTTDRLRLFPAGAARAMLCPCAPDSLAAGLLATDAGRCSHDLGDGNAEPSAARRSPPERCVVGAGTIHHGRVAPAAPLRRGPGRRVRSPRPALGAGASGCRHHPHRLRLPTRH